MSPVSFTPAFLDALTRAVLDCAGTQRGAEITFRCPFPDHEDLHPSATFNTTKTVFWCRICKAAER